MMRYRVLPLPLFFALLVLPVLGDPPKDAPAAPAPAPAPAQVDTLKFHMMDGSVITAKMVAKELSRNAE